MLVLDGLVLEAFLKVGDGLDEVFPFEVSSDAGIKSGDCLANVLSCVVQESLDPLFDHNYNFEKVLFDKIVCGYKIKSSSFGYDKSR